MQHLEQEIITGIINYSVENKVPSKGYSGSYNEARSCQRVFDMNPTFWGSV